MSLLSKLLGDTARAFNQEYDQALASTKTLEKFLAELMSHKDKILEARAAFLASPNETRFQRWVSLEASRDAVSKLVGELSQAISGERETRIQAIGMARFQGAWDEIARELDAREKKIVAQDAARAEELGVPIHSEQAIAALDKVRDALDEAMKGTRMDFAAACSALRGIASDS